MPSQDPQARLLFACRLVEKAFHKGHRLLVVCENEAQRNTLDDLLWDFKKTGFVPHEIRGNPGQERRQAVEIDYHGREASASDSHQDDVLINLTPQIPADFGEFQRITEIVIQDEAILKSTRDNWKQYKSAGLKLDRHDMRN